MKKWKFKVRKNFPENTQVEFFLDFEKGKETHSILDLPWLNNKDQCEYDKLLSKFEGYTIEGNAPNEFNTEKPERSELMRLRVMLVKQANYALDFKSIKVKSPYPLTPPNIKIWDAEGKQIYP